jgi:hypothetical protein
MDVSVEHEREELERCLHENGQAPQLNAGPASGGSGLDPSAPSGGLGAQGMAQPARPDFGDSILRQAGAGGSGETGFVAGETGAHGGALGSTLGASPDRPPEYRAPAADPDMDPANEQQAELMQQARAQGGQPERSAPDQTRAEGRLGSINDSDGL